ncbi:hypothetical protein D3H65_13415 [Paraflavitalea soli]|uniref:Uncharacterized protein n=1 Tax=Paraflavitalea soli TaxID=2315862 RepID=A0A3B7MPL0_9BACT|nr:hypothetical protein [Paraflavitalea soli]AXY74926.1 hypothetical protein D3H65_13415 [Paraflavitalea soli]
MARRYEWLVRLYFLPFVATFFTGTFLTGAFFAGAFFFTTFSTGGINRKGIPRQEIFGRHAKVIGQGIDMAEIVLRSNSVV